MPSTSFIEITLLIFSLFLIILIAFIIFFVSLIGHVGCNNKINGWSIGTSKNSDNESDADSLYDVLEKDVIPTFYENKKRWISIMRNSIKTGVDFTSQRMLRDYQKLYYS